MFASSVPEIDDSMSVNNINLLAYNLPKTLYECASKKSNVTQQDRERFMQTHDDRRIYQPVNWKGLLQNEEKSLVTTSSEGVTRV